MLSGNKEVRMSSVPNRITGIWWMSDDPDNKVPGDLLIDTRKLELNGSFTGLEQGHFGGFKPGLRWPVKGKTIQGFARKGGKRYTLEFFDNPGFTMNTNTYQADTYSLGNIFEGNHFEKTDNLSFERYYVEFPYLFEWVNDGIISVETVFENSEPLKIRHSTVKIEAPKEVSIYRKDGLELSFAYSRGGLPMMGPFKDIHMFQRCSIKVSSKKGIGFQDAYKLIMHVSRLVSIGLGKSILPVHFEMSSGAGLKLQKTTLLNVPAKLGDYKKTPHLAEMNFIFDDIKGDSQSILDKWLSDRVKHVDMFDLFSSIQTDRSRNPNNQFLDIVSAIEGYVRVETGNLGMDLVKTIKTVNENLPKADRLLKPADYENIRITRNKLSHVALDKPGDEVKVYDLEQKVIAIQKLTTLLEYALLKNLGVSDKILSNFYQRRKMKH